MHIVCTNISARTLYIRTYTNLSRSIVTIRSFVHFYFIFSFIDLVSAKKRNHDCTHDTNFYLHIFKNAFQLLYDLKLSREKNDVKNYHRYSTNENVDELFQTFRVPPIRNSFFRDSRYQRRKRKRTILASLPLISRAFCYLHVHKYIFRFQNHEIQRVASKHNVILISFGSQ